MRIIEVMCSILIFSLTILCVALSFTTVIKNERKTEDSVKSSLRILEADYRLREKVRQIDVSYWKNMEIDLMEKINNGFFEVDFEEISIVDIKEKRNEDGLIVALCIKWSYREKIYETIEGLCVGQVINEKR